MTSLPVVVVRLSSRRLAAIEEALTARLAGEIEDVDGKASDYVAALQWCRQEIRKRSGAKP